MLSTTLKTQGPREPREVAVADEDGGHLAALEAVDGVPDNVIAEAWRGKENPAVPTPDGVREPRNRRVEIVE